MAQGEVVDGTLVVIGFAVVLAFASLCGVCIWLMFRAFESATERADSVIETLSDRFTMAANQNLDISEMHLQARRDEWDGKNGQATHQPRHRVPTEPDDERKTVWDVSATSDNGTG